MMSGCTRKTRYWLSSLLLLAASPALAEPAAPLPIIDVHLHAYAPDAHPPAEKQLNDNENLYKASQMTCAPYENWPARDPGEPIERYMDAYGGDPECQRKFKSVLNSEELRKRTIAELERLNIVAVTSGDADVVAQWHKQAPDRIIPGFHFGPGKLPPVEELRALHAKGQMQVLGEVAVQLVGIAPNDPRLEPYYALAEELDIPFSMHVGPNAAGLAYFGMPDYRASLGDPLLLEEVLLRHPRMRIYVNHAGYPMGERMIALMQAHPQVYVDTAAIGWIVPRAEFYRYLKLLVDAGFGKRIMFGSDQMLWPEGVAASVEEIQSADFLTAEQKRDILYNNAARFLRLEK